MAYSDQEQALRVASAISRAISDLIYAKNRLHWIA
jgi:hypothetical protein